MPLPTIDISASMNSSNFVLQQFCEIFHAAIQPRAADIPTLVFLICRVVFPPGTNPAAER